MIVIISLYIYTLILFDAVNLLRCSITFYDYVLYVFLMTYSLCTICHKKRVKIHAVSTSDIDYPFYLAKKTNILTGL